MFGQKKLNKLDKIEQLFAEDLFFMKEIDRLRGYEMWFVHALNEEMAILAETSQQLPTVVKIKYPLHDNGNNISVIYTSFGGLSVIVDPDMKEIIKLEEYHIL